ncbi:DUF1963 domain-containing protein [Aureimonas fodinaquatilis]|nr:DUF1963 domain-containing protein [Aureimonas fodinaquatilis]
MDDGLTGWPVDGPALHSSLLQAEVPASAVALIIDAARPAMMLTTTQENDDVIAIGSTKFGGRPDLPATVPWPHRGAYANAEELIRETYNGAERFHADAGQVPPWMSAEDGKAMLAENERLKAETRAFMQSLSISNDDLDAGFSYTFTPEQAAEVAHEAIAKVKALKGAFPLAFLAQIDLADLSSSPGFDAALPRDGRLYFFYDLFVLPPSYHPASSIGLRVIHDRSPADELVRAELPEALAAISDFVGTSLKPATVTAHSVLTAVPQYSAAAEALGLSEADLSTYGSWLSQVPGWPGDGPEQAHQLGGWRRAIQATMEGTAQLAANGLNAGTSEAFSSAEGKRLLEDEAAWRLVFQLGPDDAIGNLLPGALNILMRQEDLKAGRFEKAWAVYEQD